MYVKNRSSGAEFASMCNRVCVCVCVSPGSSFVATKPLVKLGFCGHRFWQAQCFEWTPTGCLPRDGLLSVPRDREFVSVAVFITSQECQVCNLLVHHFLLMTFTEEVGHCSLTAAEVASSIKALSGKSLWIKRVG